MELFKYECFFKEIFSIFGDNIHYGNIYSIGITILNAEDYNQ